MDAITLVEGAIHNPAEPRHFMEFRWSERRCVATLDGHELARSARTLKLCEVGRHVYDPVLYFPLDDVHLESLKVTDKTTHCPLKGDTCYYDYIDDGGAIRAADVAWRYVKPFDFAAVLADYIAFDPARVEIREL